MAASTDRFKLPKGSVLQLSGAVSANWVRQQLETNEPFRMLHDYFSGQGFSFRLERSKVFVQTARGTSDSLVPAILGILPSFVPTTSVDKGHAAVGISVHHLGSAVATKVMVSHEPFGVTEFTLYEIDPSTKEIISSDLSAERLLEMTVEDVAGALHKPSIPGKSTDFAILDEPNQAFMIGSVINQLLRDRYSSSLFPPAYASALRSEVPAYQKFALATSLRYDRLGLEIEFCTSSSTSTSSNICTSTSTSGDIFAL